VEPLIRVTNLRYRYADGTQALDGVDFELQPGETVALLGANGSGKTTFVLHLIGLLTGEGDVTVCGLPVTKKHLPEVRRKLGLVFQEPDEQLFMPTVLEDVCFGPLNLGLTEEEAVREAESALARVGMEAAAEKAPYHLSAGEKRRVAVAGVLAMNPEILVLDEPTTHLDPPARHNLLHLLASLPQAKLLVTHNTVFARQLCNRAVFFENGRITDRGSVEDVISRQHWDALHSGDAETSHHR
jgi:cobalt/nickel transport system ATP-binding protein